MSAIREALEAWRQRRAEQQQWADAPDFAALRELTARWCLGELSWAGVGQPATRDPETVEIGEALAAINRAGLLTHNSQPATDFGYAQQRAHVVGYATPETEEQLRRLIAGTRLRMTSHLDRSWLPLEVIRGALRGDPDGAAARWRNDDGTWRYDPSDLGRTPPRSVDSLSLGGVPGDLYEQVTEMPYLCVWDPQWEPSDLLWRRLSAPDWDNPPPLADEDRAHPPAKPQPAKPSPSPSTPPPAAPTTSSPGAAMTSAVSYGSLKARLLGISGRLTDHQSPLQQALQGVEDEIAELQATSEDSNHAGIQEALGHLMRAKESIEEAVWMAGAAQAGTEGAAAELS